MTSYDFKTYIADGREHFLYRYRKPGRLDVPYTKRDFPFPESLLELLYLDIWSLEPLTKQIDRALGELYRTQEERWGSEILGGLSELASKHIYFEFLLLDWRWRLERSRENEFRDAMDVLPHKQITHIPSDLDNIQKQILRLFARVLDVDGEKKPVSQKMAEYYIAQGHDTLNTFQFQPRPLDFEVVDSKTFAEVLYPESIYDLIDFNVRECVKREVKLRECKNCGRYFYFTGRSSAEYCTRTRDEKGRTCKEIGAAKVWEKSKQDDVVFREYRREYKKRFARMKAGTIAPGLFYQWSKQAREKKAQCDEGGLTLESFTQWLKDS